MPQRADTELGFGDFGVGFVLSCCLFFVGFFSFHKGNSTEMLAPDTSE